ncbi:TniQ family protein [Streptomyces sp. ISL-96]|nr:TniQ family protein [Streptomyces sp. ISL-96]
MPGRKQSVRDRALPLQVRFVPGESTGSYVTRLAARNGLAVGRLLDSIGKGKSKAVDPRYTELYMNRAGRDRLATLTGLPLERLTTALISTRDEQLLPEGRGGPVWVWPWQPRGGYLVRGCALCAASRGVGGPVWLMQPDQWRICVRHGRFSDNSRDDAVPFVDLSPGPHVVEAERRRLALVRRLGAVGRALVADAFGVLAHEAVGMPRLGSQRTVPLRLLPTVVEVAYAMARLEKRRLERRVTPDDYDAWEIEVGKGMNWSVSRVLTLWSRLHGPLSAQAASPRSPGVRLAPEAPHAVVGEMASVDEVTCVPWQVLAVGERPYG